MLEGGQALSADAGSASPAPGGRGRVAAWWAANGRSVRVAKTSVLLALLLAVGSLSFSAAEVGHEQRLHDASVAEWRAANASVAALLARARAGDAAVTPAAIYGAIGDSFLSVPDATSQPTQRGAGDCFRPNPSAKWGWLGSYVFMLTLATTIGYGSYAPQTSAGKGLVVVFCTLCIPVMGLLLTLVGSALGDVCEWLRVRTQRRRRFSRRGGARVAVGAADGEGGERECRQPAGEGGQAAATGSPAAKAKAKAKANAAAAPTMEIMVQASAHFTRVQQGAHSAARKGFQAVLSAATLASGGDRENVRKLLWQLGFCVSYCVTLALLLGALASALRVEGWSLGEHLYFSFVTFTTVGLGDYAPNPTGADAWTLYGTQLYTAYLVLGLSAMTMALKALFAFEVYEMKHGLERVLAKVGEVEQKVMHELKGAESAAAETLAHHHHHHRHLLAVEAAAGAARRQSEELEVRQGWGGDGGAGPAAGAATAKAEAAKAEAGTGRPGESATAAAEAAELPPGGLRPAALAAEVRSVVHKLPPLQQTPAADTAGATAAAAGAAAAAAGATAATAASAAAHDGAAVLPLRADADARAVVHSAHRSLAL